MRSVTCPRTAAFTAATPPPGGPGPPASPGTGSGTLPRSSCPGGPSGFAVHGIETAPQFVVPGWLVDVAPLGPGDVIGVPDIDPQPGDAVLFHTGWGEHWDDPDTYLSGQPGPGLELAEWLADRDV